MGRAHGVPLQLCPPRNPCHLLLHISCLSASVSSAHYVQHPVNSFQAPPNSAVRPPWLAPCTPYLPDLERCHLCLMEHWACGTESSVSGQRRCPWTWQSNVTEVGVDLLMSIKRYHLRMPTSITGQWDIFRGLGSCVSRCGGRGGKKQVQV